MGPKHEELRKKLKEYLDVQQIDLFTNGHMALELTLQALNLPKGSEVITTPFTFASTTHAIVRNGLEPVFCDINPQDFTIDVSKLEELIADRTSAIMPVHVYGNICNVEEIKRIAEKYSLKVVYDAAHTFGVKYKIKGLDHSETLPVSVSTPRKYLILLRGEPFALMIKCLERNCTDLRISGYEIMKR